MTTDQTYDDWEPLDWDTNPARIGDEVEVTYDKLYGVSYVKSGVIVSFDGDGDPSAMTDRRGLIGGRGNGTWRVRRKSTDPLDENEGKVIRDVEMHTGVKVDVAILAGSESLLADWGHGGVSMHPTGITAFTTDDRTTRYTWMIDTWAAETLKETQND